MVVHSAIVVLNLLDSLALFCAAILVRSVCLRWYSLCDGSSAGNSSRSMSTIALVASDGWPWAAANRPRLANRASAFSK